MTWRRVLVVTGLMVAVLVAVASIVFVLSRNKAPVAETRWVGPTFAVPGDTSSVTSLPGITPEPMPERRNGHVIYRAPSPMRVNDVQRVAVLVADEGALLDLTSGPPGTGPVSTSPAPVGTALTADLSGPDFQITRVGSDDGRRELPDRGIAEWAWDVRPQKGGTLQLDFVLYIAKDIGGVPSHYRTYAHEVEVEVNFPYSFGKFVKDYGALTGLSVPVVAGAAWTFLHWLRKKRAKSEPEPVEE